MNDNIYVSFVLNHFMLTKRRFRKPEKHAGQGFTTRPLFDARCQRRRNRAGGARRDGRVPERVIA